MTEQEKNELAKLCDYSEERYTDEVKEGVKKSEYDKDRENAILRKTVKALLDKELYGTPIPQEIIAEFEEYNAKVEQIKAEAKKALGI